LLHCPVLCGAGVDKNFYWSQYHQYHICFAFWRIFLFLMPSLQKIKASYLVFLGKNLWKSMEIQLKTQWNRSINYINLEKKLIHSN
jgi:hypothetical protein